MIYNETKYNKNWNTYKLNELGTFARGKSKHRPRNDKKLFIGGGYPLIQTGDVKSANIYISKHSSEYNEFGLSQSKLWDKGTLCITIAANIAETALLEYPMCFPDSIVGFNSYKDKCSEIFMHYIFTYIKQAIQKSASGSIQDNINLEYLENLEFKIPSIDYQNKINDILFNIDKKININNLINEKIEYFLNNLFRYWFLQFEFPNENGKPYKCSGGKMVWNQLLKKEIPEGWNVQNLKENDLTEILNPGIEMFKGNKIYIATGDVENNDIVSGKKVTYENRESRANMQPIPNTVWFAKMKNSVKHIFVGEYSESLIKDYIFSTGFLGLKCVDRKNLEYINCFINSEFFEVQKDKLAHGATQEAVNNNDIRLVPLIIPDNEILEKFHERTKDILKKIYLNNLENEELKKMRNFLLPLLMNGQVTFKDL